MDSIDTRFSGRIIGVENSSVCNAVNGAVVAEGDVKVGSFEQSSSSRTNSYK